MVDSKHTPGPWKFEPHNGFGGEIEGEAFPFGYISTSPTPMPIFELNVILGFDIEQLRANARMMAAAPELLEALEHARNQMQHPDQMIDEAITKAERPATP